MKERRYKIVRMDQDLLVSIFNWHLDLPHCIALPISEHLPEGARVVAVNYNPSYGAFDLKVEHESFSPVALGCMIPAIPVFMSEYRTVEFRDIGKQLTAFS